MFPENRNRRLRKNSTIRAMVQENRLHPSDFIVPLFFMEGENKKEEIASMPGYFRYTSMLFNRTHDVVRRVMSDKYI